MYKHILIATDGSELSEKALEQGLALAKPLGAKVTVATTTEPWDAVIIGEVAMVLPVEKYEETANANARAILSRAEAVASNAGVTAEMYHMKDRHPAEGLLEAAKSKGCDLIVMGSHGRRGFSRMVLGSQANEVITHSEMPVLVVR
ncbi:MAG: universal stress protein [Hyphomicrobiales bacterium]|nr:universal stress protein [Hyphomicrobiales bacterium]